MTIKISRDEIDSDFNDLLDNHTSSLADNAHQLYGDTALNIFSNQNLNGNFDKNFSGWTLSAPNYSTMLIDIAKISKSSRNSVKQICNNATRYIYKIMNFPVGHQIYFCGWIYIESYSTGQIALNARNTDFTLGVNAYADTTKIGTWQFVSGIKTVSTNGQIYLMTASSMGIAITCTTYYSDIMTFDLTAIYGASVPIISAMDTIISTLPYFEGTIIQGISNKLTPTSIQVYENNDKPINVLVAGCSPLESNATINTQIIQNLINGQNDIYFPTIIPINSSIIIPNNFDGHSITGKNRKYCGLNMIVDNMSILEAQTEYTNNIYLKEIGLFYKNQQTNLNPNSRALYFNATIINGGFSHWNIEKVIIQRAYKGIEKNSVSGTTLWGNYFNDVAFLDISGTAINIVSINAGQLDNKFYAIRILKVNGSLVNDGNSAIMINGDSTSFDGLDIEDWWTNNNLIDMSGGVVGYIQNLHLERLHLNGNIIQLIKASGQLSIENSFNYGWFYEAPVSKVIFMLMMTSSYADSDTWFVVDKFKIGNSHLDNPSATKYLIDMNNSIPCKCEINGMVISPSHTSDAFAEYWSAYDKSKSEFIFKNVYIDNIRCTFTNVPTGGTWNLDEKIYKKGSTSGGYIGWVVTDSGTIGTNPGITGSITSGTNTITTSKFADGVLKIGEYVTIAGVTGRKKIIAMDQSNVSYNIVTIDSNSDATVASASITYYAPTFKTFGLIS